MVVGTGASTVELSPQAMSPAASSVHRACLFIVLIMWPMMMIARGRRRVLRHTIPCHPVHGQPDVEPAPDAQRPEGGLAVEGLRVEQATIHVGNPAIRHLH